MDAAPERPRHPVVFHADIKDLAAAKRGLHEHLLPMRKGALGLRGDSFVVLDDRHGVSGRVWSLADYRGPVDTADLPRYRCDGCGNLTRFDVTVTQRSRAFHHFTVGGDLVVEDEVVLSRHVDDVVCRWCGHGRNVVEITGESGESGQSDDADDAVGALEQPEPGAPSTVP